MNATTLRVKFPSWPGWHVSEFNLTSLISTDSAQIITVHVDPESPSDYGSDSPVFRASIESTEKGIEAPILALKFAMRDDLAESLEDESRIYCDALQTLQGSALPRFYGVFAGVGEEGQQIRCLVLEYWGESLQEPFHVLPLDLKIQILERLGAIHREGLLHGDFAERNVLVHEGFRDVRIIDFDRTERHDCQCEMNFCPGQKPPDMEAFGCDQLWEVCRYYLRIWDTTTDI